MTMPTIPTNPTASIHGVEILSVGKWVGSGCPDGGCEFTTTDLDQLVQEHANEPNFRPPVKLGHGKQSLLGAEEIPAAGYIRKLWREGDKLLADISDVPARLAELFKKGAWRNRSIELDAYGASKARRVSGLALLGSAIPAVSNLADIESLYQQLSIELPAEGTVVVFSTEPTLEQSEEQDFSTIMSSFEEVMTKLERHYKGRKGAPDLRALARMFRNGVNVNMSRRHELDDTKIRQMLGLKEDASEDDVLEAVGKLKATPAVPATPDPTPAADTTLAAQHAELNKTVLGLQTQLAQRDAAEVVDAAIREGKLVPAQRESSLSFALSAPVAFKEYIEKAPKVVTFAETGSASGETQSEFEPTALDIRLGREVGNTVNDIKMQKYQDAGKQVPAELLAVAATEHPAPVPVV